MNLTKNRGQCGGHSFEPIAAKWLASRTDDDNDELNVWICHMMWPLAECLYPPLQT